MSYISPNVILSTLIRAYKVRSKRILTESEKSLVATTTRSIPLTAFNFSPQQIALTLFHLSHVKSKSASNSCYYSLIQRFLTIPSTLSNPYLTLPILHSINHSKIVPRQSGIIHMFISSILKPEIITQYLHSVTDTASLIYLVDSITKSVDQVDELHLYNLNVVISQVLDHFSQIDIYDNRFSDTDSIASLVTLLTLGSHHGLDILKYSRFLPLLLKINVKKFPKYTLVDSLEITQKISAFDEYCTFVLTEISGFDDLGDYPRHLLQRILLVAACKNWKDLKLLDNISKVLCETSHTNIGISSIILWLEAFKKLNYHNKSALELLLRHTLSVKGASDKYPNIYQLFRDLQFDHFLLNRLQILSINTIEEDTVERSKNSEEIDININKQVDIDNTTSSIKKLLPIIPKNISKRYTKSKVVQNVQFVNKNAKLARKTQRNRENIARFWSLNYKKYTRKNIRDNSWRLSVSGNISAND